jgi:Cu/Ag efflux pump CusA
MVCIFLAGLLSGVLLQDLPGFMSGGMITAPLVSMVLLPGLYSLWQQRKL